MAGFLQIDSDIAELRAVQLPARFNHLIATTSGHATTFFFFYYILFDLWRACENGNSLLDQGVEISIGCSRNTRAEICSSSSSSGSSYQLIIIVAIDLLPNYFHLIEWWTCLQSHSPVRIRLADLPETYTIKINVTDDSFLHHLPYIIVYQYYCIPLSFHYYCILLYIHILYISMCDDDKKWTDNNHQSFKL